MEINSTELNGFISKVLKEASKTDEKKVLAKMKVAVLIDSYRKKKGWNKKELAKAFGKSPSEISKWLSGTQNFTIDTLIDIGEVLNVNLVSFDENSNMVFEYKRIEPTATVRIRPNQSDNCYNISKSKKFEMIASYLTQMSSTRRHKTLKESAKEEILGYSPVKCFKSDFMSLEYEKK